MDVDIAIKTPEAYNDGVGTLFYPCCITGQIYALSDRKKHSSKAQVN